MDKKVLTARVASYLRNNPDIDRNLMQMAKTLGIEVDKVYGYISIAKQCNINISTQKKLELFLKSKEYHTSPEWVVLGRKITKDTHEKMMLVNFLMPNVDVEFVYERKHTKAIHEPTAPLREKKPTELTIDQCTLIGLVMSNKGDKKKFIEALDNPKAKARAEVYHAKAAWGYILSIELGVSMKIISNFLRDERLIVPRGKYTKRNVPASDIIKPEDIKGIPEVKKQKPTSFNDIPVNITFKAESIPDSTFKKCTLIDHKGNEIVQLISLENIKAVLEKF